MAEHSPAITVSHPPLALLRIVNPILRTLLHAPLLGPARKQLMVLSFPGRKTGRQYSIPLSAHRIDGDLCALTGAPWKLNFRGGAPAQVLHDGNKTSMRGELIEDRATVADLYRRCAESHGAKGAQRAMGLKFREGKMPSPEDFVQAVEELNLAAIRLTSKSNR